MQLALDMALPTSYAPDDIVVTESNADLVALLDAPPPAHGLLLVGETGSGKTHLARRWHMRHGAAWIPVERIGHVPAQTLLGGRTHAVMDGWDGSVPASGFVALLNELRARGGCALVTCTHLPTEALVPLPDVRSRLQALALCRIPAPDDALLEALLYKGCSDRQWHVDADVIAYILPRIGRSFADIQQVFARLEAGVASQHCRLSLPKVRALLA